MPSLLSCCSFNGAVQLKRNKAISGGGLYNYAGNTTFKKRVTMEDNDRGNFFVRGGKVTFERPEFVTGLRN